MAVLFFAVAVIGCGDSGDSNLNVAATTTTVVKESGPTVAALKPLGGARARGTARYSKKPDGSALIRLRIYGLEPLSGDRQYAIWQKRSRDDMLLLATWSVGSDRRLFQTWEPNAASLGYLETGLRTKLLITKVENSQRLYSPGASENSYVHHFIGTPVLEGDFTGALVGTSPSE